MGQGRTVTEPEEQGADLPSDDSGREEERAHTTSRPTRRQRASELLGRGHGITGDRVVKAEIRHTARLEGPGRGEKNGARRYIGRRGGRDDVKYDATAGDEAGGKDVRDEKAGCEGESGGSQARG